MADREHEKRVLDEFIGKLRPFGYDCADWGLLENEPPDALATINGEQVFIELTRYREVCYYDDLWSRDGALKHRFHEAMLANLDLSECTVRIEYFSDQRRNGYGIGDDSDDAWRRQGPLIPHENEQRPFVDALLGFVRERVRSGLPFDGKGSETGCDLLRTYCERLIINLRPGTKILCLMTSMGRFGGTDVAAVRDQVEAKIEKVAYYRQRVVGDGPLWLVYYTEPHRPTGHPIGPHTAERVTETMKEVLAKNHGRYFDAVWWFDRCSDGGLYKAWG